MGKVIMFPKQFVHCHICHEIDFECDKECYEQFCEERNINIHSVCFICPECVEKSVKDVQQIPSTTEYKSRQATNTLWDIHNDIGELPCDTEKKNE
tara:strand:+ start:217 stop:504 length:288 start_codon:yes stop_codon:yes gene_type:complete